MSRAAHSSSRSWRQLGAGVDDRVDPHARVVQIERGEVGAVVGGEHDGLLADLDSVAVQEGAGAVGKHDARPVVVGEHDGTLVGAGRDHDAAGPDPPHPLTADRGGCLGAEVIGAPLQRQHEPVVVVAECGGALQVQHVGIGGQFGDGVGDPVQRGPAVDGVGAAEQRATGFALLVEQHHPRSGTGPRSVRRPDRPARRRRPARRCGRGSRRTLRCRRSRRGGPGPECRARPSRRTVRRSSPAASARGTGARSGPGRRCPRPTRR